MPKLWTLKKCFESYGAKAANPRWSWSARSEDGETVVLTLWKDLVTYEKGKPFYDCFGQDVSGDWIERPGNRERLENLVWARDYCRGEFRVVITEAENIASEPRKIARCFPQPGMTMRITDLNDTTGEFRAESFTEDR